MAPCFFSRIRQHRSQQRAGAFSPRINLRRSHTSRRARLVHHPLCWNRSTPRPVSRRRSTAPLAHAHRLPTLPLRPRRTPRHGWQAALPGMRHRDRHQNRSRRAPSSTDVLRRRNPRAMVRPPCAPYRRELEPSARSCYRSRNDRSIRGFGARPLDSGHPMVTPTGAPLVADHINRHSRHDRQHDRMRDRALPRARHLRSECLKSLDLAVSTT
jgi:hypothetical protein